MHIRISKNQTSHLTAILAKAINFCSKIQPNQSQSVIPINVAPILHHYRAGGKTIALNCRQVQAQTH